MIEKLEIGQHSNFFYDLTINMKYSCSCIVLPAFVQTGGGMVSNRSWAFFCHILLLFIASSISLVL